MKYTHKLNRLIHFVLSSCIRDSASCDIDIEFCVLLGAIAFVDFVRIRFGCVCKNASMYLSECGACKRIVQLTDRLVCSVLCLTFGTMHIIVYVRCVHHQVAQCSYIRNRLLNVQSMMNTCAAVY